VAQEAGVEAAPRGGVRGRQPLQLGSVELLRLQPKCGDNVVVVRKRRGVETGEGGEQGWRLRELEGGGREGGGPLLAQAGVGLEGRGLPGQTWLAWLSPQRCRNLRLAA